MLILGIDPGKTTGYAVIELIERHIQLLDFGTDKNEQVDKIGELLPTADLVVCEDFKIRPNKARAGHFDYNDMVAPRVIGKVELLCKMSGTKLEKQAASLKPPAYGFAGMRYVKGKKGMHWQDAYAHAVYYCVKNLQASPVLKTGQ